MKKTRSENWGRLVVFRALSLCSGLFSWRKGCSQENIKTMVKALCLGTTIFQFLPLFFFKLFSTITDNHNKDLAIPFDMYARGCFCSNFGKLSYHCPRPPPSLIGKAWNIFPSCGFMKKSCIKMSWLRQNNIWLWYDFWFWCQIRHFWILLNFRNFLCLTFTSKTTSLRHVSDKVLRAKWPHGTYGNIMFLSKSGLYHRICY